MASGEAGAVRIQDPRWVEFLYQLVQRDDAYLNRRVVVTPYHGGYGIAGFVVTVAGSPPKIEAFASVNPTMAVIVRAEPPKVLPPGTRDHERFIGYLRRYDLWPS